MLLHDAGTCLQSGDALEGLAEACPPADSAPTKEQERRCDFNRGYLCCLAKKPTGEDPHVGTFFAASATRPLSVMNTDNRLLANSWRGVLEPIFEKCVPRMQRGFLRGRSMLRNIVDIDFEAMKVSLRCAIVSDSITLLSFDLWRNC